MKRTLPAYILSWFLPLCILLLFNNWLLAPLINHHLSLDGSLISEISARTQPHHWVFQMGDIAAGLLTLAYLPYVWQFARRHAMRYATALVVLVAVIAVGSIVDASLPISCAPSVDAHCRLDDTHSMVTMLHLTESTVVGVMVAAAPMVWWYAMRKAHRHVGRLSIAFALVQLLVGAGILLMRVIGVEAIGWWQRLYEAAIGVWVAGVAAVAYRANHAQADLGSEILPDMPKR